MSENNHLHGLIVVLVTYGDRWLLLEEVLRRLIDEEMGAHCIVVDNGSLQDIQECVAIAGWTARVTVVRLAENMGSAAGYATGIACALQRSECTWLYLLDDDNRPYPDALRTLENWMAQSSLAEDTCLLSLRNDRPEQSIALATNRPIRHKRNSFMGFDFFAAISRTICRVKRRTVGVPAESVELEFAPYGGLLFHRSWIKKIGLPDSTYFVYVDDHEFTSRIVRAGGRIILVGNSRVEDLETSWHLKPGSAAAGIFSLQSPDFRLYYSVRNRVYFERYNLVDSYLRYFINAIIFFAIRYFRASLAERSLLGPAIKVRIALRAFSAGWSGRLGRHEECKP